MHNTARALFFIAVLTGIAACAPISVNDYKDSEPRLDLETFFQGTLTAHGVVKNRSGRVIRTFNASIDASWADGEGVLDEHFEFDDGELDHRKWVLVPTTENRYNGTAGDVVGKGRLEVAGNSVFLDYTLRIPLGDKSIDVKVDDRMYLIAPGVLLNESELTKFGVRVGTILLVILQSDVRTLPPGGASP